MASKFIVSDGVFSMDGDIAPIPELAALAATHSAMLMIDDAHGVGMLGENGRGSLEHHGVSTSQVDLQMGTFTKAFGGVGGYVSGDKEIIDFLRISARTYIFSAPLPPAIAAGVAEAIDIAEREPWRREKALENAFYFRREVEARGYETLGSEAHIVPALIGDEVKAGEVTRQLRHRGIVAPHARYPAVGLGRARIRFVMTCQHDREQIDFLLKCLSEVRETLEF
jgi:7-keto-8-aminopelargonate synthetase-like enzyme